MKKINNQKGQAIFEFIIFIPFLVFMFTIFYTVGNAINGGIDHQKAVRGYYYNLVKGNSYLVTSEDLIQLQGRSIKRVGFFSIAWREHGDETKEYAPCFKFSSMFKGSSSEECDGAERLESGEASSFVRIFTAYGVCGPTYVIPQDSPKVAFQIIQSMQTSRACVLGTD